MKRISWRPRWDKRKGTYCSSACGRGCTRAEYLLARRAGAALQRECGQGRVHVCENLGWHCEVVVGNVTVTRHITGTYTVQYQHTRHIYRGRTLRAAMRRLNVALAAEVAANRAVIAALERML
jgi:hypothetical protein